MNENELDKELAEIDGGFLKAHDRKVLLRRMDEISQKVEVLKKRLSRLSEEYNTLNDMLTFTE